VPFRQVKTIPPYVVGAASVVISSWLAWRLRKIGVFMIWCVAHLRPRLISPAAPS